jgi:hypothetical protein
MQERICQHCRQIQEMQQQQQRQHHHQHHQHQCQHEHQQQEQRQQQQRQTPAAAAQRPDSRQHALHTIARCMDLIPGDDEETVYATQEAFSRAVGWQV